MQVTCTLKIQEGTPSERNCLHWLHGVFSLKDISVYTERNVFCVDPTEVSVRLFESSFHKFLHVVISCNYLASLMLLFLLLMNDLGT